MRAGRGFHRWDAATRTRTQTRHDWLIAAALALLEPEQQGARTPGVMQSTRYRRSIEKSEECLPMTRCTAVEVGQMVDESRVALAALPKRAH